MADVRPEMELLFAAARTQPDRAQVEALATQALDWDAVLRLAVRHEVPPLLYRNLAEIAPDRVPAPFLKKLRRFFHAHLRRAMLLASELSPLMERFEARGIPCVPFKGPVVAAMAYGDITLRPFGDLDVLVKSADVQAATELLKENGFEEALPMGAGTGKTATWRLYLPFQRPWENANGYIRDGGTDAQVPVDLHWGIAPRYFTYSLDPEALWQRLQPLEVAGQTVRTFSPEDTLLHLCLHGTIHHWATLRLVCDVAEMIRSHPDLDWPWIFERARVLQSQRMLRLALCLADDLLAAPLPAAVRHYAIADPDVAALVQQVRHRFAGEGTPPVLDTYRLDLGMRDRRRDGLGAVFYHTWLAVRPSERDRAFVALPDVLSPLYYAVRPVRVLAEKAGLTGRSKA
ncbi:MAG: nucleotidyltransferase domain-containing protein [Rhodothermales bacterium]